VLRVGVSAKDFGDDSALSAIATALGGERVNIVQDPDLASGDCLIDLRLGQIELSIPKHWQLLQDELRRLASAGEAP
jgi:flagellar biosynthesis/type III secretory pathway protein FliH